MIEIIVLCLVAIICDPAASQYPRDYYTEGYKEERLRSKRMVGGDKISAYDAPYMCSIHYTQEFYPVSACSIITSKIILTSMVNMDESVDEAVDLLQSRRKIEPGFDPVSGTHYTKGKLALKHWKEMSVIAGKDTLKPAGEIRNLRHVQQRSFQDMYIVDSSKIHEYESKEYYPELVNPANNTLQDFDFFTYKFNFMFLTVVHPFTWSTHVLPIPMDESYSEPSEGFNKFKKDWETNLNTVLEKKDIADYVTQYAPGQIGTVAGWGTGQGNRLEFKEAMAVPFKFCQWNFCSYSPVSCLEYPLEGDLCFTSTSYGDVCDFDQSSALYCPFFKESVCGFVKKSISCGFRSRPVVYIPGWMILKAFASFFQIGDWEKRPDWNEHKIYGSSTPRV